jgi:hypothetical protein
MVSESQVANPTLSPYQHVPYLPTLAIQPLNQRSFKPCPELLPIFNPVRLYFAILKIHAMPGLLSPVGMQANYKSVFSKRKQIAENS